jgi:hypothetical protein
LCLAPGYWYSLEDEDDLFTAVLATARLNQFKYETLLLSSKIPLGLVKLDYHKSKLTWQQTVAILHWQP